MVESLESIWSIASVDRCLLHTKQKEISSTPFKRVLLISAPYLYKRHMGARNLADW